MSVEAVHAFIAKVDADSALSAQVARTMARPEAVVSLAASHGFAFTREEGEQVLQQLLAGDELSDALLEVVAGGQGGGGLGSRYIPPEKS